LLLICSLNYGQTVRKYSNEFMNIGVDAAAPWQTQSWQALTMLILGIGTRTDPLERPSNFFDARQLLCQYRNMIISLMPAHR
jgi:hypothetical protein